MKKLTFLFLVIAAVIVCLKWGLPQISGLPIPLEQREGDFKPSIAISDLTLDRFEKLRWGELSGSLELSSVEVSSVARYAVPGIIPSGILEPTVELEEGRARLSALVVIDRFPGLPPIDEVVGHLPDTITIEMWGSIVPLDRDHVSLVVEKLWMARIPIPSGLIPSILMGLGRQGARGLPRDGLLIPKPPGIESIFVSGGSLILLADSQIKDTLSHRGY